MTRAPIALQEIDEWVEQLHVKTLPQFAAEPIAEVVDNQYASKEGASVRYSSPPFTFTPRPKLDQAFSSPYPTGIDSAGGGGGFRTVILCGMFPSFLRIGIDSFSAWQPLGPLEVAQGCSGALTGGARSLRRTG